MVEIANYSYAARSINSSARGVSIIVMPPLLDTSLVLRNISWFSSESGLFWRGADPWYSHLWVLDRHMQGDVVWVAAAVHEL
jgi:hypothetical protein